MEDRADSPTDTVAAKLTPDRSAYPPPELVALAKNREQYLKEIDRRQPISITEASMEPLIHLVAERIKDDKPPGWLTLWRNYRQWLGAGRDVRAITLRHADRGKSGTRMLPDVRAVSDEVIDELYMTVERRRVRWCSFCKARFSTQEMAVSWNHLVRNWSGPRPSRNGWKRHRSAAVRGKCEVESCGVDFKQASILRHVDPIVLTAYPPIESRQSRPA